MVTEEDTASRDRFRQHFKFSGYQETGKEPAKNNRPYTAEQEEEVNERKRRCWTEACQSWATNVLKDKKI